MRGLGVREALLVADAEETVTTHEGTISIVALWKWLAGGA